MATPRGVARREPAGHTRTATERSAARRRAAEPPRSGVAMLRVLQTRAGNAAVTRLVQRSTGACPAPPQAPVTLAPKEDPRFVAVAAKVGRAAAGQRRHPPAAAKAAEAQMAAEPPSNDRQSQASAAQAEVMNAQQPGTFDKKAFVAAVRKAIEAKAPKSLEEADEYPRSGKAGEVKGEVSGLVGQGKDGASKGIKTATEAPPDPSRATPKPVTPMRDEKPGAVPPDPGSAQSVPQPRPPDQTDLRHGPCQVEGKLAGEGITNQQLAEANEPEFSQALDSKQELAAHSAAAPQEVRAAEAATLDQARGEAKAEAGATLRAMHGARATRLGNVNVRKSGTKAKDEARRAEVAAKIQSLYQAAKTEVTSILDGLDTKVNSAFDAGERAARSSFEAQVAREMADFRRRRYSGWRGPARWLWDKATSPPAEVNRIFDRARTAFLAEMDRVIERVADIVGTELTRAKDRIARGRDDISKYVASLPKDLRQVGKDAAGQVASQFDALEQDVSSKQDSLVQGLADRYVAAQNAINDRVNQLQEENKGLLQKAADAVGAVVDAIRNLKNMLLNVLSRAADAIGAIIAAPVRFVSNLVSGVKAGLQQFIGNIGSHLQKGLITWLTGNLASAGITMPDRFDLRGIISLVLQLLGLTWQNLRARLVRKLGEPLVRRAEQAVDIVKVLVTEGPAGLWRWLVDKLADLKDTVFGEIKSFLINKVIVAGIQWIIGLLSPAGAFIKACKAIYDIVMFFVTRGSQVMSLVNAVIDAVGAIARGAVGGVASLIEGALAKAVPVVIGFLASLLGLGGIGEKIRSIFETVQRPVNKAIDWVLDKVVGAAKKLGGWVKGKFGGKKKDKESPAVANAPDKVKADTLTAAAAAVRGKSRIDEVGPALDGVRRQFAPRGLKSLTAEASSDVRQVTLKAVASPPETRTIAWKDVFPNQDLEQLRALFQKAKVEGMRGYTVASLSIDGQIIGSAEFNESATRTGTRHAEEVILARHWPRGLDMVRERVAAGDRPKVVLAVNRSPCQSCSASLRTAIAGARSDPGIGSKADFILAPTTVYEGKMDKDKKTTGKNLIDLVELEGHQLGWDIRQLVTKEKVDKHWELPLAEYAAYLWRRFKERGGKAA